MAEIISTLNVQHRYQKQDATGSACGGKEFTTETRMRDCLKSIFAERKTRFQATTCTWRMDGDNCTNKSPVFLHASWFPWLFFFLIWVADLARFGIIKRAGSIVRWVWNHGCAFIFPHASGRIEVSMIEYAKDLWQRAIKALESVK